MDLNQPRPPVRLQSSDSRTVPNSDWPASARRRWTNGTRLVSSGNGALGRRTTPRFPSTTPRGSRLTVYPSTPASSRRILHPGHITIVAREDHPQTAFRDELDTYGSIRRESLSHTAKPPPSGSTRLRSGAAPAPPPDDGGSGFHWRTARAESTISVARGRSVQFRTRNNDRRRRRLRELDRPSRWIHVLEGRPTYRARQRRHPHLTDRFVSTDIGSHKHASDANPAKEMLSVWVGPRTESRRGSNAEQVPRDARRRCPVECES
jgi:hypothetical protein